MLERKKTKSDSPGFFVLDIEELMFLITVINVYQSS